MSGQTYIFLQRSIKKIQKIYLIKKSGCFR